MYFLRVEYWAIRLIVLRKLPQLLDPDLAGDKSGVVKLLATCNCLQQVEREIPAEIQAQEKILTSQDGRK